MDMKTVMEIIATFPLLAVTFAIGLAGVFVLWGSFCRNRDRDTRALLLPICILLPVHVVLIPWTILLAVPLNLILLLALIPCVIEAIARKKPLLGIAVALCVIYLLVGLYACYEFWTGFDFPRN